MLAFKESPNIGDQSAGGRSLHTMRPLVCSKSSEVEEPRAYARRKWRDDGLLEPGDGRGRATDGRLRAGAEAPRATAPLLQRTLSEDLGPSVGRATISGYRQEAIKLSIRETSAGRCRDAYEG